ncbi:hypothetical protein SAMN05444365_1011112 [Micromonospora pattaloongensis]|uniref:Uncharacterized protein n=1 Tax=Micromonospora pattaloongensis TaxID=405436 RepID=A0A1H3I4F8_9ACTN|nr:hypothetical protein [Micromonospora pattaloongensis]SDY22355.1 hypothetical protein SAMN05444365_1011112 [Micromonospora pattaloongensis]
MGDADSIRNTAGRASGEMNAGRADDDATSVDERSDEADRGAYWDHLDRGMDVGRGQREVRDRNRPAP